MRGIALAAALLLVATPARAETKTAAPQPSAPPAKELFGNVSAPAALASRAIGSYARGCLAGAMALPVNGSAWQAMRLSRNRVFGSPSLVTYIERLAVDANKLDGWPGLLVGDMSQPRGGPMITGHSSHQVGLDVDIWLLPMPDHVLSKDEREQISAVSMLKDPFSTDPKVMTEDKIRLIRRAASYPEVARIFVHPAIKKTLCDMAGPDRGWLRKVRPWWGHNYHFHVRLNCPPGMTSCVAQSPLPPGDGCTDQLSEWFAMLRRPPKPTKPRPPLTLAQLPADCRLVLTAPAKPGFPVIADPVAAARASKDAGPEKQAAPGDPPTTASTETAQPLPTEAAPTSGQPAPAPDKIPIRELPWLRGSPDVPPLPARRPQ